MSYFEIRLLLKQVLGGVSGFAYLITGHEQTEANKFYDRTNRLYDAALLSRCYTPLALHLVIDSKINQIRHFIKIPFINKGKDFIDLPSIFRDKSVQLSIPNYFKNYEVPIICYEYNKTTRGAIFNFNKLLILISKLVTLTPATARILNMFIWLRVMLLGQSENHF